MEHFVQMLHPMENFETIEDFAAFPYPDPAIDFKWDDFKLKTQELKSRDRITVASMACTNLEIAWYLRDMDIFMIDMLANPELANCHLDIITEIRCEMLEDMHNVKWIIYILEMMYQRNLV